jgi:hypothetical protein
MQRQKNNTHDNDKENSGRNLYRTPNKLIQSSLLNHRNQNLRPNSNAGDNKLGMNKREQIQNNESSNHCIKLSNSSENLIKSLKSKLRTKSFYSKVNYILSDPNKLYHFSNIWKSKLKYKGSSPKQSPSKHFFVNFYDKFSSLSKEKNKNNLLTTIVQKEHISNEVQTKARLSSGNSMHSITNLNTCTICKKQIFKMKDKIIISFKNPSLSTQHKIFHKFCYKVYKNIKKKKN